MDKGRGGKGEGAPAPHGAAMPVLQKSHLPSYKAVLAFGWQQIKLFAV